MFAVIPVGQETVNSLPSAVVFTSFILHALLDNNQDLPQ
jgi:hypothetical protein